GGRSLNRAAVLKEMHLTLCAGFLEPEYEEE
ncbi:MAG: hypothetical protein ACI934_002060, partial [Pseudohongiellaceae bacterium]